jgi:hypothetical protein
MYRRPKFLEVLREIRQEMAREADYDVELFAEMVRSGSFPDTARKPSLIDDVAETKARTARKRGRPSAD